MMNIKWTTGPAGGHATESVVQVSELRLRSYRDVPRFLRDALGLRRTVLAHEGAHGIALRAAPLRRTFWTLSAWDNEASIADFVRGSDHRDVMIRYRERMDGSHFHTWFTAEANSGPPQWDDSMRLFEQDKAKK